MTPIRTSRLMLEPQVVAHADEMFVVLSDPAIYEHENEPPASLEWLLERIGFAPASAQQHETANVEAGELPMVRRAPVHAANLP